MNSYKQLNFFFGTALMMFAATFSAHAQEFDLASIPYVISGEPAITKTNVSDGGGVIFEIRFNTDVLVGDLVARSISADGDVAGDTFDENGLITSDGALWRASRVLSTVDHNDRVLFTSEIEGTANTLSGEVFRWADLDSKTREKIDPSLLPIEVADATIIQNNILDYVRGDNSLEGFGPTDLRPRDSDWIGGDFFHNRIGNIVRSTPAYVPSPREFYTDPDYNAFRVANKNREAMLYVGANDGMLHAFKASNGDEVFGYIPAGVHDKLADFSNGAIDTMTYSVDGSPLVKDAKGPFPQCGGSDCWRTILISGLNAGGRSIYALDVTDPVTDASSETNAKNKIFLWEFAAQDLDGDNQIKSDDPGENANLGYTFSEPIITQLNDTNGTWVAIFGNGYNALEQNDKKSVTLFIVNLATGALIKSIEAVNENGDRQDGDEPNGLSTVTPYDRNLDGKVDLVYAGDLWGNLWKFDLTGSNPANYDVAYFVDGKQSSLIQVTSTSNKEYLQPITTAPLVTQNPDGGLIVYFGTGAALESDHDIVLGDRGVFGIYDEKPVRANDNDYPPYGFYPEKTEDNFELDIHTLAQTGAGGTLRGIANTSPANSPDNTTEHPDNVGWFLKFPPQEQLLTNMTLVNKRLSFVSTRMIPGKNNFNWLNGIDFLTGAAPATPYFDANIDGEIKDDGSDLITIPGPTGPVVPIAGALGVGIASSPRLATVSSGNDVFLHTTLVEFFAKFDSPFTDGGLPGGHFDEDEAHGPEAEIDGVPIDWDNIPWGESHFGSVKHTHEYDDKLDINGVHLLRVADEDAGEVTEPTDPPHVESSAGMLDGYLSVKGGIEEGEFEDDQGNTLTDDIVVQIDIINPHSVDTLDWARDRAINEGTPPGLATGTPIAKPANFYFACADPGFPGTNYAPAQDHLGNWIDPITAPDFMDLPVEERRCTLRNMTQLMVRYNDINAMRATSPGCVKSENTYGPLLPPTHLLAPGQRQNTRYHDGAFTVRVSEVRNPGAPNEQVKPFYENYNYEHLKDLDGPPRGMDCGEVNEDLRAWREIPDDALPPDPCDGFKGDDLVNCRNANAANDPNNPSGSLIEFGGSGGFIGFVGVPELRVDPYAGGTGGGAENCPGGDEGCNEFLATKYRSRRVNWREVLSE